MDYSLDMVTTVAACDALLVVATEDKENLERRRRNLDESIGNFGERTTEYNTEIQAVVTLLDTYGSVYDALPEGKNKMTINLEMKRLEARKAQLDKSVTSYNTSSLIGKQVDYNQLDNQVPVIDAYITALQARRTALSAAALRVN